MENNSEILYELSPKFDFFYELTMPSGKRLKSSIMTVIICIILTVITFVSKSYLSSLNSNVFNILSIGSIVILVISILLVAFRILLQSMEYKGIKYRFYKDYMVCENNFLNQTRKTIEYSNIREVEIRKNVTDRLMNYGIIIIYTNAEKAFGSATVIYAVKNIEEHYNKIQEIIHAGTIAAKNKENDEKISVVEDNSIDIEINEK